jgi:hypothetical protein
MKLESKLPIPREVCFPDMPIPREARDRQLRFQLHSGREHSPRDMSSSETGNCYGEIDGCNN